MGAGLGVRARRRVFDRRVHAHFGGVAMSEKAEHTPGPWKWFGSILYGGSVYGDEVLEPKDSYGTPFVDIFEVDEILIAAAPALLKALEDLERVSGQASLEDDPVRVAAREVISEAKAASL